jgi:hypothetical protein
LKRQPLFIFPATAGSHTLKAAVGQVNVLHCKASDAGFVSIKSEKPGINEIII